MEQEVDGSHECVALAGYDLRIYVRCLDQEQESGVAHTHAAEKTVRFVFHDLSHKFIVKGVTLPAN